MSNNRLLVYWENVVETGIEDFVMSSVVQTFTFVLEEDSAAS